jgi:hypothetical protein
MRRARTATAIIWSTVVSAGAMLGSAGCGGGGATRTGPVTPVGQGTVEKAPPAELIATQVSPGEPIETLDDPAFVEPAPPAEVARVKVTITSNPAGADVYASDDGQLRGRTPLQLELEMSDQPMTLRITRDGYDEQELVVQRSADTNHEVALVKAKRIRGGGKGKGTGRGFILS